MPNFVSRAGIWNPKRERVSLTNESNETITVNGEKIAPGEPFIYEGPDRAAVEAINEAGGQIGVEVRNFQDLIDIARNKGFSSVDEYLKARGWDEKAAIEKADAAIKVGNAETTNKVKSAAPLGGGRDFSGSGKHRAGGFGEIPEK